MRATSRLVMTVLGLGLVAASQAQNIATFPYNESFEQGDGGWTYHDLDNDGHSWLVVDFSGEFADLLRAYGYYAHDGNHVLLSQSVSDEGEALTPNNWAVSPVFDLSADVELNFVWYAKALMAGYTGDRYEVRLAVAEDGGETFTLDTNDFSEVLFSGTLTDLQYTRHSVSLATHAGESVRIALHHSNSSGIGLVMIDMVGVMNDDMPMAGISGPTMVFAGDTNTWVAAPQGGSATGLAYTWIADDADHSETSADGDTIRLEWDEAGARTIGLAMQNAYGTDTAWMAVTVVDCRPNSTYPWTETFDATAYPCWYAIDADGDGEGWTVEDGAATTEATDQIFGGGAQQDNWLVTPPMVLSEDSAYILTWQVATGQDPYGMNTSPEYYSVLMVQDSVHTQTSAYTSLFAETIASVGTFVDRRVMVGEHGNDTVRFAFRYHNNNGNQLYIDNLLFSTFYTPIVNIGAPQVAFIGDSLCFTLDTLSPSVITDVMWRVQLDADGSLYEENTMDPFCFAWDEGTEPGTYTVWVEVSNENGTTVDSVLVQVIDCPAIEEYPYAHTFGSDEYCWIIDEGWQTGIDPGNGTMCAASLSSDANMMQPIAHDNRMRTPMFAIPADGTSYELVYRVGELSVPGDNYTLSIISDGDTQVVLSETLWESATMVERRVLLDDYAGSEVRFEWRHHNSPGGHELLLSGVEIRELSEPAITFMVPATARNIDMVNVGARIATAEEHSVVWTLNGATPATDTNATVVANWAQAGTYTIVLEVSTPNFTTTDSTTIVITPCDGNLLLPVAEEFDNGLGCWRTFDLDGDGYGWEMLRGGSVSDGMNLFSQMTYNASNNSVVSWSAIPTGDIITALFGGTFQALNANNLLSSPAIELGYDEHYTLSLEAASLASLLGMDYTEPLEVLLATTEPHTLADYDTVIIGTTHIGGGAYQQLSADLTPWRGQTVYIGLHHQSSSQVALIVDHLTVSSGLGIGAATDSEPQANIYPNPTFGTLNIDAQGLCKAEVYDMTGRLLMSGEGNRMDVSALAPGIYHLHIVTDNGSTMRRFVKQ